MIKTKLRPYQREAVKRALKHDGFAFLMDMRTGKTLTALAVVDARKDVSKVLVICPKRARLVWGHEVYKHLDNPKVQFWVLNYEAVALSPSTQKDIIKWQPDMVILDEMHRIKNRTSKQARVCHKLGRLARYRLGLTGTAISQGPQDAYSQFKFIDPTVFPEKWSEFQARYLTMGGYLGKQIVGYRNLDEFNRLLHSRSYRVTLNEVVHTATRIQHIQVPVELTTGRKYYDELEQELVTEINGTELQAPVVVAKLQKLQQICGGAVLSGLEDDRLLITGREKLDALNAILTEGKGKAVVFARYLHEITRIVTELYHLDLTCEVVRGGVEHTGKFDCNVIIVQVQSGLAIDLSAADRAIFYSADFSYVNFEQAKARILAHGKPKAVYYYLSAKNTVDSMIYRALRRKTNVAKLICDEYRTKGL